MPRLTRIIADDKAGATEPEAEFIEYNADVNYDSDTEIALQKLKESFAGTESKGTLWVYQVATDEHGEIIANAKPTMLFNGPLDRYELEEIVGKLRNEYMAPGTEALFRVTATVRGSQGMRLNRLIKMRKPAAPEAERTTQAQESMSSVLKVIQESQSAMFDRMDRMMQTLAHRNAQAPAMDPMQTAFGMMAAMSSLTGQLVRNVVPGSNPAPPADPMAMVMQTMELMKSMRGFLMQDASESVISDDPDSLPAILNAGRPYLAMIGQMLNRTPALLPVSSAGASNATRRRRVAGPATINPQGSPSPNPTQVPPQMFAQLRPQLEALTKSAADGASAEDVAPMVIQAIPEGSEIEQQFIAFLESPAWWSGIKAIYPQAAAHEAWFSTLRTKILEAYEPEDGKPA